MFPILRADFGSWDDRETIFGRSAFNPPTFESFGSHWTSQHMSLYVPVTSSVWHILANFAQRATPDEFGRTISATPFKFANVVTHVATTLVLFALVRRMKLDPLPAFVGAAAFAVHPIQVEAVGWTSGLKDLLGTLFMSLAALRLVSLRQANAPAWRVAAESAGLTALAILSKPAAVVTPAVLLAIEVLWFRFEWRRAVQLLPAFAVSLAGMIVTMIVQPANAVDHVALHLRPVVAADALGFYLTKLLVPVNLAFDYGRTPARVFEAKSYLYTLPVLLAAAAAVGFLAVGNRRALVPAAMFLLPLVPVLGFVPFEFQYYSTVSDHYVYPAMTGVALGVAMVVGRLGRRAAWVAAVPILVFTFLAHRQARTWYDGLTISNQTLSVNPLSWASHVNRAAWYIDHKDFGTAEWEARRAYELKQDHPDVMYNIGAALARQGRHEEAIEWLTRAVELKPTELIFQLALARTLERAGRLPQAKHQYRAVLTLDPQNSIGLEAMERLKDVPLPEAQ